jgi:hypothetical protein
MSSARRSVSLPALLIAAAGLVAALSVWQTVMLARDNAQLRDAIFATAPFTNAPSALAANVDAAELNKAQAELELARTRLRAAEDQAAKFAAELTVTPAEELKSLGRSDVLAAKAVSLMKGMDEMLKAQDASTGKRPSVDAKNMAEWLVNSEAIGDLEGDPAAVANVHAHALREKLGLDEAMMRELRGNLTAEFQQLRAQGMDRPSRPDDAQDDWYAKRDRTLLAAAARIEQQIPAKLRKPRVIVQIMNLGSGFRTRTQQGPTGEPHIELVYQVPGMEPIRF